MGKSKGDMATKENVTEIMRHVPDMTEQEVIDAIHKSSKLLETEDPRLVASMLDEHERQVFLQMALLLNKAAKEAPTPTLERLSFSIDPNTKEAVGRAFSTVGAGAKETVKTAGNVLINKVAPLATDAAMKAFSQLLQALIQSLVGGVVHGAVGISDMSKDFHRHLPSRDEYDSVRENGYESKYFVTDPEHADEFLKNVDEFRRMYKSNKDQLNQDIVMAIITANSLAVFFGHHPNYDGENAHRGQCVFPPIPANLIDSVPAISSSHLRPLVSRDRAETVEKTVTDAELALLKIAQDPEIMKTLMNAPKDSGVSITEPMSRLAGKTKTRVGKIMQDVQGSPDTKNKVLKLLNGLFSGAGGFAFDAVGTAVSNISNFATVVAGAATKLMASESVKNAIDLGADTATKATIEATKMGGKKLREEWNKPKPSKSDLSDPTDPDHCAMDHKVLVHLAYGLDDDGLHLDQLTEEEQEWVREHAKYMIDRDTLGRSNNASVPVLSYETIHWPSDLHGYEPGVLLSLGLDIGNYIDWTEYNMKVFAREVTHHVTKAMVSNSPSIRFAYTILHMVANNRLMETIPSFNVNTPDVVKQFNQLTVSNQWHHRLSHWSDQALLVCVGIILEHAGTCRESVKEGFMSNNQ